MTVRSRRLAAGRIVGTSQQVIYTVPQDRTAIVKSVLLQNDGAGTVEAILSFRNSDSGTVVRMLLENIASNAELWLMPWAVLEEGDDIRLQASVTNDLNFWVSGPLLLGDPT